MSVLFLGPSDSPLLSWLQEREASVAQTLERITERFVIENGIYFIISYGYRHKISKAVVEAASGRAINLHISYLPWNRGADPNLWSFVEGTPKGVSIHYVDDGIDTGDIIAQRRIEFDIENDTLASSYAKLHLDVQALFKETWQSIKDAKITRQVQPSGGTYHYSKDKERVRSMLSKGWETPIRELCAHLPGRTQQKSAED